MRVRICIKFPRIVMRYTNRYVHLCTSSKCVNLYRHDIFIRRMRLNGRVCFELVRFQTYVYILWKNCKRDFIFGQWARTASSEVGITCIWQCKMIADLNIYDHQLTEKSNRKNKLVARILITRVSLQALLSTLREIEWCLTEIVLLQITLRQPISFHT